MFSHRINFQMVGTGLYDLCDLKNYNTYTVLEAYSALIIFIFTGITIFMFLQG